MSTEAPQAPEELSPDAIGRKAGRGLRWSVLGTLATKVGSFAMSLVMARLLAPEDFGLFAIALAATMFAMHVNDVGVIAATVQWRGKLSEVAPTATTMAVLFSACWYGIFFLAAPYFAELAGSADAAPLVRILCAVILVDGITAVRVAALQRRFHHDRLMIAISSGFVANATVAITLAANGAGPYSFVIGQFTGSVVTGLLVLRAAKLQFRFGLEKAVAAKLVRFGIPVAIALGIESILLFADTVIVGNMLGATMLGLYLVAFNVSSWVPGLATTAVRYVSVPGFSRLAEHEGDALSEGVQKSVPVLVGAILPVAAVMGILAPELIVFLYGARWEPAAEALSFLAIAMIARIVVSLTFDILTSMARTRTVAWLNLCWAIALIPALIVGTRLDGIQGAAIAHAVVAALVAVPLAVRALHRCGVRLAPVVPALLRPVASFLVAGGVMWLLSGVLAEGGPFAVLAGAGGGGVVLYCLLVVPRAQLRALAGRISKRREADVDA